jgi:hypothetical protein
MKLVVLNDVKFPHGNYMRPSWWYFYHDSSKLRNRDSSVGIALGYGLDDRRFESR